MNKVLLTIIALTLLVSVAGATTQTIGGANSDDRIQGNIWCGSFVATDSGAVSTLGINIGSHNSGLVMIAIYQGTCNGGTLLGNTTQTAVSSSGWLDASVPQSVTLALGNTYSLVVQTDGSGVSVWDDNINGLDRIQSYGFGSFPSTIGATTMEVLPNMRVDYTPLVTTTTTTSTSTSTSVSITTSSVTTTIPTTTSVSTSTSSVTTTIPTTTSVSTTTSTSVPITFTTTINPRNSTLVNATTACKDLPCVLSYSFAIPEISLIFVFVAFGIAWQVTHKLINGLASALIVAIVMVGIAPTLLNIGVLVVIGFFVVLGYYTHAFERKSD